LSQIGPPGRLYNVNAPSEALISEAAFDFEAFFQLHYERIARAVAYEILRQYLDELLTNNGSE
jgi:hypothetical protein